MGLNVFSLDQVQAEPIRRVGTGYPFLDYMYGITYLSDNSSEFGPPRGKITVCSGPSGIGKTQIAISMAASLNNQDYRVLFCQGEVTPGEFKGWIRSTIKDPSKFFVSDETELDKQIEVIKQVRPDFVVVDSINMVEGIDNPAKTKSIMDKYRKAVQEVGCHVIFIAHLNKKGDTKGSGDIEYLGDILVKLEHRLVGGVVLKDYFVWVFGKNRYGKSGGRALFQHTDKGIAYVTSTAEIEFNKHYKKV